MMGGDEHMHLLPKETCRCCPLHLGCSRLDFEVDPSLAKAFNEKVSWPFKLWQVRVWWPRGVKWRWGGGAVFGVPVKVWGGSEGQGQHSCVQTLRASEGDGSGPSTEFVMALSCLT